MVKVAMAAEDAVADGLSDPVDTTDTELDAGVMTTVKVMTRVVPPMVSFKAIDTVEPGVAVDGTAKPRVVLPTRLIELE